MPPDVKQHYQQKAEEGRQKYDQDMAVYRQGKWILSHLLVRKNNFLNLKRTKIWNKVNFFGVLSVLEQNQSNFVK